MNYLRPLAVVTAILLSVPLGRTAELDPYMPEDTEYVLNLNLRQIFDSDLIKKHLLAMAQEALRGDDQVQDVLKDLGLDPFKDLDRVLIASPASAEKDRGLLIAHGRFNVAKFKAKAANVAKDNPDHLKIQKVLEGTQLLYEVSVPNYDDPVFVAIADSKTLLLSPGKDYVVNALKKVGKETKPTLKNKTFQKLLGKIDDRQSLSLAAVSTPELAKAIDKAPGDIKGLIEKVQAVAGGLTISDEIKLELAVTTKNPNDAKELGDAAKNGLNSILGLAAAFVQKGDSPGAEFVVDLLKSLRVTSKGETVTIKGRVSSDTIEDAFKKKDK